MTTRSWTTRVSSESALVVLLLAALAGVVGGPSALVGVLAGGALAVGNFWWLCGRVRRLTETPAGPVWIVSAGFRFVAIGVVAAVLFASGLAHPVAVLAGVTVLPCALIVRGLRSAATEPVAE